MALAAGPKPRTVAPLPAATGDPATWIEHATGQPLYPWQRGVLSDLTAPGRPRVAYVQVPRKNGKTRLAACLALAEVCLGQRRHIYAISDSERNLNSVLIRELRDLIGGSQHLRDSIHIYQNHLEIPETGSFIETRPNNFKASQGINPHLVLFDEVHLQRDDQIWSGMQMAGAARPDALMFGITTPGYDLTGLAHGLYTAVKAGDPTLYGRIYESDPAAGLDDRGAWDAANPCYHRPGFADAMAFDRTRLPEHEFRRFRLGQWTATDQAWLPHGAWAACADPGREVDDGTRVWLGFDGSYSGDSTALVGVTDARHVFVAGAWENPGRPGWRVPRGKVEETIHEAMARWKVQELLCDPPYWGREISEWATRWPGKVLEFPTFSRARMAPACTSFYAGILEQTLTHDADPRLARHIGNAVVKTSPQGDYITKVDKDSPAKIDLAVASVIAYSRASVATRKRSPAVVL
ncbi:MAG: terminase large subunit domain-containing protein [Micromonosporaceae bacterium]